ncbi:hypothetical protein C5167_005109 [Papaver somniferum]|uniref:Uncharacterized protein n=1 Tax=Papaver somniferum TaxID=3469 RepID=A0A4Y7JDD8_PAPSO|nr:hypothetical protein C5167_005109 [Papaver somniferum]
MLHSTYMYLKLHLLGTDLILRHGMGRFWGTLTLTSSKTIWPQYLPMGGLLLLLHCGCEVRYHLSEDPKTLKVFPVPLHDSKGETLHYDSLSISPDGKVLAATHDLMLQWLYAETGKVLDTADKAHDGTITGIAWAPKKIPMGPDRGMCFKWQSCHMD